MFEIEHRDEALFEFESRDKAQSIDRETSLAHSVHIMSQVAVLDAVFKQEYGIPLWFCVNPIR